MDAKTRRGSPRGCAHPGQMIAAQSCTLSYFHGSQYARPRQDVKYISHISEPLRS
jgi:hypothetical protein